MNQVSQRAGAGHCMTLADGRRLAWREFGEITGTPVVALHGITASHRQYRLAADPATDLCVGLIAPDRPGYGGSSFHPGRGLLDTGRDIAQLVDHLGLEHVGLVGISAGGADTLAAASLLGRRVRGVSLASCVAPLRRPRDMPELVPSARAAFTLARHDPRISRLVLEPLLQLGRLRPALAVSLRARLLPAPDQLVLDRPAVRQLYEDEARHLPRTAGRSAAQDLALIARDWGIEWDAITAPVQLWHGTDDREAPLERTRRLVEILPDATLHVRNGQGHLQFIDALHDALAAATGGARTLGTMS